MTAWVTIQARCQLNVKICGSVGYLLVTKDMSGDG